MRNNYRLAVCFILIFILICVQASAEELKTINNTDSINLPMFTYINSFQNTLDITSSGKASVTAYLNARDVDEVKIVADLQQYKNGIWTTIKSWSNTSGGTSCALGETWYVTSGYSYRTISYGYVYRVGQLVESSYIVGITKFY